MREVGFVVPGLLIIFFVTGISLGMQYQQSKTVKGWADRDAAYADLQAADAQLKAADAELKKQADALSAADAKLEAVDKALQQVVDRIIALPPPLQLFTCPASGLGLLY